jgi:hypothetical protein
MPCVTVGTENDAPIGGPHNFASTHPDAVDTALLTFLRR